MAEPAVDTFDLLHHHLRQLHARPRSLATPIASLLEVQHELLLFTLALHEGHVLLHVVPHTTIQSFGPGAFFHERKDTERSEHAR